MTDHETLDLRGVAMPAHFERAAAAIDRVSGIGVLTLLTDQDVLLKYVPATAVQQGMRCRVGRRDGAWEITLTAPPQARTDGENEEASDDDQQ